MYLKEIKNNFFKLFSTTLFIYLLIPIFYNQTFLFATENIIFTKEKSFENEFYLLGPGDIIFVDIFGANEYSGEYIISKAGNIHLPLIGKVNLNYLTIQDAIILIQQKYKNELIRPELNIKLIKPRPIKISIVGEIKRPGFYTIGDRGSRNISGKSNYIPTIIDAIQDAGGITKNTNLKEVIISRKLPGKKIAYKEGKVNLLDLILNGNHIQNTILYDGDIIKLKTAKKLPSEIMSLAEVNLSPKNITVSVIGKVENPQKMEIPVNTPLNQAILYAGGPISWKSNKNNVELVRVNRNGTISKKKFKLDFSENVSNEFNPPLSNNDIIRVKSSFINNLGDGLSTITKPFSNILTAVTIFKIMGD